MYTAAALRLAGDEKNADLAFHRAMDQRFRDEKRYYGTFGSNLRDLAKIMELSLVHGFDTQNLVPDLVDRVKQRRYLSTQERMALFKTALVLHGKRNEPWSATLVSERLNQKLRQAPVFTTVFDLEQYHGLEKIQAGQETVYADIRLTGQTREPPRETSRGITVHRKFYDTRGEPMALETMTSGKTVLVRLDITADRRTPDGLVVDLLPAGLEIENQNLSRAAMTLDGITIDGTPLDELKTETFLRYEAFRSDRYLAAVDIPEKGTVRLFYLVRAVTPGSYQIPPSYVEDMYRPFRFGVGKTPGRLRVVE